MSNLVAVLAALLIAHALGDFLLQRRSMIEAKRQRRVIAYLEHGVLHLAAMALTWWLFVQMPLWQSQVLIAFAIIIASHLVIDWIKETTRPGGGPWTGPAPFVLDQLAHLSIIVGLTYWLAGSPRLWSMLSYNWELYAPVAGVVLMGYLFVIFGVGYLNANLLPKMAPVPARDEHGNGMENAGLYIGWLERFLLLTAVLLQSPAALGLIVAAKSIFRFDDIRQGRATTEYFLIGTLLSVSQAVLGGLLIMFLLRQVL
jgi:hypothetical protein